MSVRSVLTAALAATIATGAPLAYLAASPAKAPARATAAAASAPAAATAPVITDGWPRPMPATGPDLVAHDPSMVRAADGRWYVFSTHDGIQVRSSADQKTWRREAPVFPDGTPLAKKYAGNAMEMWAPDVTKVATKAGPLYVLYYAASSFGSNNSAIGLATSPTALPGSWTDRGQVFATTTADTINAIDPDLFVDPSGKAYLTFGSFWSGIAQIRLDPATGKRIPGDTSAPTLLASRPDHPTHAIEAPSLVEHDGWYYLFTSFDYCCRNMESSYRVMVGRARSPQGPFVDRTGRAMLQGGGTQVVGTHDDIIGPGGEDISFDDKGAQVVYHYYDGLNGGTPHLAINRLVLDAAGWPHLQ